MSRSMCSAGLAIVATLITSAAAQSPAVYGPASQMYYVKAGEKYGAFNNSNQATARWLRELGFTVKGSALTSKFVVEPAPESERAAPQWHRLQRHSQRRTLCAATSEEVANRIAWYGQRQASGDHRVDPDYSSLCVG